MSWSVKYDPSAEKELSKLDKAVQRSIKKYLAEVRQLKDPAARGHGLTGPWAGFHRYRVGRIRLIEVGDKRPSGPSLKLLSLIERRGLEAVL